MAEIDKIIQDLKQKVVEKEKELIDAKKAVNSVCRMYGMREIYIIKGETEPQYEQLRGDEFYGRPLATVITEILTKRKVKGAGPAKIKDIYEEMKAGGYQFRTKNNVNAMRGIRISVTKNPKFHQLPSGKFGLTVWYPKAKEPKEGIDKGHNELASLVIPKKRGRPRKSPKPMEQPKDNEE